MASRLTSLGAVLVVIAGLVLAIAGCDVGPVTDQPGDQAFQSAVVETGDGNRAIADTEMFFYSPVNAAWRTAGTPGSNPGLLEAEARVGLAGHAIHLVGTYQVDGSFAMSGDGWSFSGKAGAGTADGSLVSDNGAEPLVLHFTSDVWGDWKPGMMLSRCACMTNGMRPQCVVCNGENFCCFPEPMIPVPVQIVTHVPGSVE